MLTRDGQVRNSEKATAKAKCTVNKNITLYAVQKKAVQLTFHRCDGSTWQKTTLAKGSSYSLPGVRDAGKGLDWFTTTGWAQLYSIVQHDSNSILSKKTAVIFNFGVNDLSKSADYAEYYNWIAPQLKSKGCELYFMSVNPVNRLMLPNAGRADRSEAAVRSFNQYMKANLSSAYTYIDMYSYLKSTGYSFASDHYGTGTVDDGLHYTTRTYKRIFAKCMDSLRVPA